ncbi:MAG: hypothetical protein JXB29_10805 [Sedimentisphaerales bacterium]|nr:hypothetical protein [Sedimentisphaerales bacterium]
MSGLRVSMVGFDIAPRFHPEYGAWGTTPVITETDMPLLTRCLALEQDGRLLIWFSHDLCGNSITETDSFRDEMAGALKLNRDQVIWSTSQTHSSPTFPGSNLPGGSGITTRGIFDEEFSEKQRKRFLENCIDAAKKAIDGLQPADVWVGKGYCDSISYNTRFPMPTGGVKFSRDHEEGLQSGKYFDPTIGLVRFDDKKGKPIGTIFNFCSHPATMINDKYLSSDFVGTAREFIEDETGGAPAMFIQGFCGDVNCYFIFGKPEQAKTTGARLGKAAVQGIRKMVPVRGVPFRYAWHQTELPCRDMFNEEQLRYEIDIRRTFQKKLDENPSACWVGGINVAEFLSVEQKKAFVEINIKYCEEGLRMLNAGEIPPSSLSITLGAVRIGDLYAVLSPGENFALTGKEIRERSPFTHTLICGDTNGLFGYIGNDEEINRGGYETDTFWKMLYCDGFRLALAEGSAQKVISAGLSLLNKLENDY